MWGVVGLLEVGQAGSGQQERAPAVDRLHEVEALEREFVGAAHIEGAGVVDADVYSAEPVDRGGDRSLDVGLLSDVSDDGYGGSAGGLDRGYRRVHGPGQPRVRCVGLGQEHRVGALAGRGGEDGEPDAAAAAGHHDGPALQ